MTENSSRCVEQLRKRASKQARLGFIGGPLAFQYFRKVDLSDFPIFSTFSLISQMPTYRRLGKLKLHNSPIIFTRASVSPPSPTLDPRLLSSPKSGSNKGDELDSLGISSQPSSLPCPPPMGLAAIQRGIPLDTILAYPVDWSQLLQAEASQQRRISLSSNSSLFSSHSPPESDNAESSTPTLRTSRTYSDSEMSSMDPSETEVGSSSSGISSCSSHFHRSKRSKLQEESKFDMEEPTLSEHLETPLEEIDFTEKTRTFWPSIPVDLPTREKTDRNFGDQDYTHSRFAEDASDLINY